MEKTISPIKRAAELILRGELVAFPTETVYGLGANALDAAAVQKIFAVKGRPPSSPLIVHVDSVEMAREVCREWPPSAAMLAERFWPGPLTLVLWKDPKIPSLVTAGLDTVGVRVPAHPVALELIREAGVPIAAPSANLFMALSPTTAEHVRASLGDSVAMVIDGGPSKVGLESTVLSLAGDEPVLLRPGMISLAELENAIGPVRVFEGSQEGGHAAPGMHARHYSPRAAVFLNEIPSGGRGVYLYLSTGREGVHSVRMPPEPDAYAAALYRTLHDADAAGWDWIAVELPPEGIEWMAIRDRLGRMPGR